MINNIKCTHCQGLNKKVRGSRQWLQIDDFGIVLESSFLDSIDICNYYNKFKHTVHV